MKRFVLALPVILAACGGSGQYDVPTTAVVVQQVAPTQTQTPTPTATVTPSPAITAPPATPVVAETVNPSVPTVVADTSSVPIVSAQDAVVPTTASLIPPDRMKHIQTLTEKSRGK